MPITAYSYIRFSTPEQMKGDSLRRQTELSEAYAKKHNLVLDKKLNMKDLGTSAYKGANVEQGALGAFIRAIDDGDVKRGSYLLVENLDRISREQVSKALRLFLSILEKGIIIVTLSDGKKYDDSELETTDLIISLTIMSRAHDESKRKGERIKAAWDNKRKNIHEKKLTKWSPKWVYLSGDRKEFSKHPDRVKIVKEIFEWSANGLGTSLIIQRLEERNIEPWDMGKGIKLKGKDEMNNRAATRWHGSYIQRLLHDRAVLGEYKLRKANAEEGYEYIENYYPIIIDEELFYRVQQARKDRDVNNNGKGAGRKGKGLSNLFSGIAYCGYSVDTIKNNHRCAGDNERMVYANKGGELTYLQCSRTKNGNTGCELCRKLWRYDAFEQSFLTHIKDIDASVLVGTPDELRQEIEEARNRLAAAKGKLIDTRKQVAALEKTMDVASSEGRELPTFVANKTVELEELAKQLTPRIEMLNMEVKDKEKEYEQSDKTKVQFVNLIAQMANLKGQELFDLRLQLSQLIKRTIKRIEVYSKGEIKDEVYIAGVREKLGEEAAEAIQKGIQQRGKNVLPFYVVFYGSGAHRYIITNPKNPSDITLSMKVDESGDITDMINKWGIVPR